MATTVCRFCDTYFHWGKKVDFNLIDGFEDIIRWIVDDETDTNFDLDASNGKSKGSKSNRIESNGNGMHEFIIHAMCQTVTKFACILYWIFGARFYCTFFVHQSNKLRIDLFTNVEFYCHFCAFVCHINIWLVLSFHHPLPQSLLSSNHGIIVSSVFLIFKKKITTKFEMINW